MFGERLRKEGWQGSKGMGSQRKKDGSKDHVVEGSC